MRHPAHSTILGRARFLTTAGLIAALTAAASAPAACSGSDDADPAQAEAPPTTVSAADVVTEDTAADPAVDPATLEGTWQSPPLSLASVEDALREAGLEQWIEPWTQALGLQEGTVITLHLDDGRWFAERTIAGEDPVGIDRGTYTTDGDIVRYTPDSGGTATYRWSITGDQLDLRLVSSVEPHRPGVPGEVHQRAIYTVAPFERTIPPCRGGVLFNYEPDPCTPPTTP